MCSTLYSLDMPGIQLGMYFGLCMRRLYAFKAPCDVLQYKQLPQYSRVLRAAHLRVIWLQPFPLVVKSTGSTDPNPSNREGRGMAYLVCSEGFARRAPGASQ